VTELHVGTEQAAAAEEADRSQAAYFRSLLVERRAQVDRAIAKQLSTMTHHESVGDTIAAREIGRFIRYAQREQQEFDRMIAALDRRFTPAGGVTVRPAQQPAPHHTIHPDGRSLLSASRQRRLTAGGHQR
jgi:hypothetical protein